MAIVDTQAASRLGFAADVEGAQESLDPHQAIDGYYA